MSTMLITQEDFDQMRATMDKDGDGMVDKDEFKAAYRLVYAGEEKDYDAAYEIIWGKIDKDGDGNLTVDELAEFYGFRDGTVGEMTDDQILQALALGAELDAQREAKEGTKKDEKSEKKKKEARDLTIKMFNIDQKSMASADKTNASEEPLTENNIKDMLSMLELLSCARLHDLKSERDEDDKETVFKLLNTPGVLARIEDQNGEMPLHKLARFVVGPDGQKSEIFKLIFRTLINKMRDEVKEWNKSEKHKQVSLVRDVNKQDNKGKTPMFQAIEMKNILMIEMLNELDRERPDSLLVTASGWSMLHQAVNTDELHVLKAVVAGLQKDGGRLSVLINLKDRAGRQPLHIAAYRCSDTDIISFLMDSGASGDHKDSGGLVPVKLAEKAGRRESKEIIEEGMRRNSKESMEGGRVGRRASKEIAQLMMAEDGVRRKSKEGPESAPTGA